MQVQLDYNVESYTIRSYTAGQVTVSLPLSDTLRNSPEMGKDLMEERQLETCDLITPFILAPHILIENWLTPSINELKLADFKPVLELDPEIIVLGTGARQAFPPAQLISELNQAGVGVEIMNTAAACRTYNFLMTDGRKVAAAIYMIEEA